MISYHHPGFQGKPTVPGYAGTRLNRVPGYQNTRVAGAQILGQYEVLIVPVTGTINSNPGVAREYPGNWPKGNTSTRHLADNFRRSARLPTLKSIATAQIPRMQVASTAQ